MKEPVDHIERTRLPWRSMDDPAMTECGFNAVKVKTITRSEFDRRLKEYGEQGTAVLTCMTCMQTARRWTAWDQDPRQAIEREIQWEGRGLYNNNERGTLLRDELKAIEMLIKAHAHQFSQLMKSVQGTVDFLEEKRKRGVRKVQP